MTKRAQCGIFGGIIWKMEDKSGCNFYDVAMVERGLGKNRGPMVSAASFPSFLFICVVLQQ